MTFVAEGERGVPRVDAFVMGVDGVEGSAHYNKIKKLA
jgi:hypothetical protein